ncbi:MAG TPA: DUF1453 domain-containing protein [Rhodanobacteraceae bacterium]|nr:DUF1453 domain-containing protein [Rhodanobacteraceae bacterium]
MPHDPYTIAAIAALVLFALWRRFRRLFGRQPLVAAKLKVRIGLLSLVALMLAVRVSHAPGLAAAGLAGFAGGIALAWLGIRLTRFEATRGGIAYTPNAYIGAVLSAVLFGRLAYRFVVLYPAMQAAHAEGAAPLHAFQRSPLTTALVGIVIGYYIAYCAFLLMRASALKPASPSAQSDAAASPPSAP